MSDQRPLHVQILARYPLDEEDEKVRLAQQVRALFKIAEDLEWSGDSAAGGGDYAPSCLYCGETKLDGKHSDTCHLAIAEARKP